MPALTQLQIQRSEHVGRQGFNSLKRVSLSIPFDADCARANGLVFAAVSAAGRKARGARAVDLMIAATSVSLGLPLFTRNAIDFVALEGLTVIVSLP